ncbi:hypothetical protein C9890_0507 [Perkinsus sp. BL_2016]|nr:hypothetical protein C9890_0507 [Perkinsus sp. BL_2016]
MHPVNSYADLTGSSCDQYTDMVKLKQFVQNGRSLAFGLLVDLLAMVLGVLFGCICMGSMPGFTPHSLYDDGPSQSVGSSFTDSVVAAANCLDTFTNASYHGPRELILAPILTVRLSSNYVTCESLDMLLKSSYDLACYDSCSVTSVPCSDTMVESGSDYFENVFLKPIYMLSEFHFPWDFGTAPRRRARTRVHRACSWINRTKMLLQHSHAGTFNP